MSYLGVQRELNQAVSFWPAVRPCYIWQTYQRQPWMLQHKLISLHYDGLCQIHSSDNTNAFFFPHWWAAGFVRMCIIKGPHGVSCLHSLTDLVQERLRVLRSPPQKETVTWRHIVYIHNHRGVVLRHFLIVHNLWYACHTIVSTSYSHDIKITTWLCAFQCSRPLWMQACIVFCASARCHCGSILSLCIPGGWRPRCRP